MAVKITGHDDSNDHMVDLTDSSQVIEELQESRHKYKTLFENAVVGMCRTRIDGSAISEVNQALCDIFECTREEMLSDITIISWSDPKACEVLIKQLHKDGIVTNYETDFITRSGKIKHCLISVKLYLQEGYIEGTAIDITSRERAEEALQDSEKRYRRLFESAKDGILILDADTGRVVDVNPFLLQLLGYTYDALYGQYIWELGVFKDIAASKDAFKVLQDNKYIRYDDLPLETINGQPIAVEFVSNVYLVEHSKVIQCNIRDITARKRAEEAKAKLEIQDRQIKKAESLTCMAGAVAHHFNNKLQVVIGNLELALDALLRGDDPVNRLTAAMRAAGKAAEMSGLMLTYLGQTPGNFESLDFSEACSLCLPMIQVAIQKNVVLETDFPSPGLRVNANKNQIQQVLVNLVTNAEEAFGEGGGSINLRVKTVSPAEIPAVHRFPIDWQPQDLAYTCLEVTDTGCGFEDKDIEKIFDPFFSSKFIGRGLGLPVVLGIVRAHHGAVTVESAPGRGSAFRVFLPLSAKEVLSQPDKVAKAVDIEEGCAVLQLEGDESVHNMTVTMHHEPRISGPRIKKQRRVRRGAPTM